MSLEEALQFQVGGLSVCDVIERERERERVNRARQEVDYLASEAASLRILSFSHACKALRYTHQIAPTIEKIKRKNKSKQ